MVSFAPGTLVHARGREWVVLPDSVEDFLVLRPLAGGDADLAGVLPAVETVQAATFPLRARMTSATPDPPPCCATPYGLASAQPEDRSGPWPHWRSTRVPTSTSRC
ncbi:MAG: hypothetical protein NVV66_08410 [Cellulomonas sp.]|nr:hypothetical protein [Cellulomonas sp.]